jgi:hypothetical protein
MRTGIIKANVRRLAAALAFLVTATTPGLADTFTPVASYEASETTLTVSKNGGDAGLTLAIVTGGTGGAPAATDGTRVLRLTISNETDKKVEFRHTWSTPRYSLAGNAELLADVWVASAGAIPGLMGIFSTNWSPPDAWQQATGIPASAGSWKTVSFNVSTRSQTNLSLIQALVFENLATTSGTIYVDNLRLRAPSPGALDGVAANGLETYNEVHWREESSAGLQGYNVYRAAAPGGPYTQINPSLIAGSPFRDAVAAVRPDYYYAVSSVVNGVESDLSSGAKAQWNGMSDDEMLDMVQEAHFQYFWNGAHPGSGMAREGINTGHPVSTVTTGGSGFGLMSIVVGAHRGFVTRSQAADRVLQIVSFLQDDCTRYHGAWSHWINGDTGATIPFAGAADNGGDLVETAFMVQGLLVVRQYFDDPVDPVETEIRNRATQLWEEVEWSWYRRFAGGDVLYWHWSPNFGWQLNLQIRGYNEAQIIYLLAIASPTYPMPASSYFNGWGGNADYINGDNYYGYVQWVGPPLGGPLFFTHYSNLGFDPRWKRDPAANYFENSRNISLINRAHCIDNPGNYEGYNPLVWGLTASRNPSGYNAHSPTSDNGTIAPTAALSAMAYTPEESLAAMRHMFDSYGVNLWGTYGFKDAFNPSASWTDGGWLAIDQGPIPVMIENYRSGLIWRLFMQNPEIRPMMTAISMFYEVDTDFDGDIDAADAEDFFGCFGGPDVLTPPGGCLPGAFIDTDLDGDGDADMADARIFQELFTGP